MRQTIKIAFAENHAIFRKGFIAYMKDIKHIQIVSECENGKVLLEEIPKTNPDIIFMDVSMPVMGGVEATEKVRELYPDIPVIALSQDSAYLPEMLKAGAVAYLEKDAAVQDIQDAIYSVYDHGFYYNKIVTEEVLIKLGIPLPEICIEEDTDELTPMELKVLELVCNDYTNSEIAVHLNISIRTVQKHRQKINRKTGTHSPIELLKFAIKNKLYTI